MINVRLSELVLLSTLIFTLLFYQAAYSVTVIIIISSNCEQEKQYREWISG